MTTYEDGLLGQWSYLCCLADVAVKVYEHEQRLKKGKYKKTTVSEEEEDNEKSFFHSIPRKPRSSFTRRNPQNPFQNLNKASTSSSSLIPDLNLISVDFEPSSSPLLLEYNTSEFEMKPPQNPNTSQCKRRAVQEIKRKGGFKKPKVVPFTWKGKETPEWLTQMMRNMNVAEEEEPKLIFEKILFETDVNPKESRFSIPFKTLIRNDFLTPVESRIIEEDIENDKKTGVGAILVDQRCVKWGVFLKRWEMKKDGKWTYALTCGWNDIVEANGLQVGDNISLWSFRCQQVLCFAIVPPPA